MKITNQQVENLFYTLLAAVVSVEYCARWLLPFVFPDFWELNKDYYIARVYHGYDLSRLSLLVIDFFSNYFTHSVLFVLSIASGLGLVFSKIRRGSLLAFLVCTLLILYIQPSVKHAGDGLLLGILICLVFGGSNKFRFVGILVTLFWFFVSLNKFSGFGWSLGSDHGLISVFNDPSMCHPWIENSLGKHDLNGIFSVISVFAPWLQLAFSALCLYGVFGKSRNSKFLLCVALPAPMLVTIWASLTVGIFPLLCGIASMSFLLLKRIKLDIRYALRTVPILYLGIVISQSVPDQLLICPEGSGTFDVFSRRPSGNRIWSSQEIIISREINESQWFLRRFVRRYHESSLNNGDIAPGILNATERNVRNKGEDFFEFKASKQNGEILSSDSQISLTGKRLSINSTYRLELHVINTNPTPLLIHGLQVVEGQCYYNLHFDEIDIPTNMSGNLQLQLVVISTTKSPQGAEFSREVFKKYYLLKLI